jgi:hypothetical protein
MNMLHLVALSISICSIVSCLLVVSLSDPRFIVLVPDLLFLYSLSWFADTTLSTAPTWCASPIPQPTTINRAHRRGQPPSSIVRRCLHVPELLRGAVVFTSYLNGIPGLSSGLPPWASLCRVASPWSTRLSEPSSLHRPKLGSPSNLASLAPGAPPHRTVDSSKSGRRRCQPCSSTLPCFFGLEAKLRAQPRFGSATSGPWATVGSVIFQSLFHSNQIQVWSTQIRMKFIQTKSLIKTPMLGISKVFLQDKNMG